MRDYVFELVEPDDLDLTKRKRANRKILIISLACIFLAVLLIAVVVGVVLKDQADKKLLRTDEEGQTRPSISSTLTTSSLLSAQIDTGLTSSVYHIPRALTSSVQSIPRHVTSIQTVLGESVYTGSVAFRNSLLESSSLDPTAINTDALTIIDSSFSLSSSLEYSPFVSDNTDSLKYTDFLSSVLSFKSMPEVTGINTELSMTSVLSTSAISGSNSNLISAYTVMQSYSNIPLSFSEFLRTEDVPIHSSKLEESTRIISESYSALLQISSSPDIVFSSFSSISSLTHESPQPSLVTSSYFQFSNVTSSIDITLSNVSSDAVQTLSSMRPYYNTLDTTVPEMNSNPSEAMSLSQSHVATYLDGTAIHYTEVSIMRSDTELPTSSRNQAKNKSYVKSYLSTSLNVSLPSFQTMYTTSYISNLPTTGDGSTPSHRPLQDTSVFYSSPTVSLSEDILKTPSFSKLTLNDTGLLSSDIFFASDTSSVERYTAFKSVTSSSKLDLMLSSNAGGDNSNQTSYPALSTLLSYASLTAIFVSVSSHLTIMPDVTSSFQDDISPYYSQITPSPAALFTQLHDGIVTPSPTVVISPSPTASFIPSPSVVLTLGETETESVTRPPKNNVTVSMFPTMPVTSSIATITMTTSVLTTSTTAQTTVTPCPGDDFGCEDGTCINKLWYCDGHVHCPDGSDETPNCKCGVSQLTCGSGQCVTATARCDRIHHCRDKTDEYNCTNCSGTQCASGLCLWRFAKCDYKVDCGDLSDELNCPFRLGYRRCDNGIWVVATDWCNGVDDCYDNSDETSCSCDEETEVGCLDKTCIRKEWVCDGHVDCVNMTDELHCGKCKKEEFECHDYSCVAMDTVCDGKPDCKDGKDEMDCYALQGLNSSLTGQIYLGSGNHFLPVCSSNWTTDLSDLVCQKLGHQKANETEFLQTIGMSQTNYYQLTGSINPSDSILSHLKNVSECSTGHTVMLNCMPKECGKQPDNVIAYIAGGELSAPGRWPWVASLSYLGKPMCAAAAISDEWLVTAGHCVTSPGSHDHSQTPFYVEVLLGSVKRTRDPVTGSSIIRVDRIETHPNFKITDIGPILWDVALLHLETRVQFSNYIQPICLPDNVITVNNCFVAGWGYIDNNEAVTPGYLREAKLNVWTDAECEKNTVQMEVKVNTDITLCAGYSSGITSACQGDSGGPLMCQDTRGHWQLTGITSSGAANCGEQTSRADRFTRISGVLDWIKNVTTTT